MIVVNDDTPGLVVNALAVAIIAKAATQRNFMLLLKIMPPQREGGGGSCDVCGDFFVCVLKSVSTMKIFTYSYADNLS